MILRRHNYSWYLQNKSNVLLYGQTIKNTFQFTDEHNIQAAYPGFFEFKNS